MQDDTATTSPLMAEKIAAATGESIEAAQRFLQSPFGSEFITTVNQFLRRARTLPEAIDDAVQHWMTQRADHAIPGLQVMPKELPYLTTFVRFCATLEEPPSRNK